MTAYTRSVVVAVMLIAGGLAAVVAAAVGASQAASVAEQLPYLASGGVGGLALSAVGAVLVLVQRRRRNAADEVERLLTAAGLRRA